MSAFVPSREPGESVDAWAERAARRLREQTEPVNLRQQFQEFTDTAGYVAGTASIPGDCWRACLASLLEVPLAEVPHFIYLYGGGVGEPEHDTWSFSCKMPDDERENGDARDRFANECPVCAPGEARWWLESIAWVEQQRLGWTLRAYNPSGKVWEWANLANLEEGAPDRLILTGKSPRGDWNHSALYDVRTQELAHDPFLAGGGVQDPLTDMVLLVREEWL